MEISYALRTYLTFFRVRPSWQCCNATFKHLKTSITNYLPSSLGGRLNIKISTSVCKAPFFPSKKKPSQPFGAPSAAAPWNLLRTCVQLRTRCCIYLRIKAGVEKNKCKKGDDASCPRPNSIRFIIIVPAAHVSVFFMAVGRWRGKKRQRKNRKGRLLFYASIVVDDDDDDGRD